MRARGGFDSSLLLRSTTYAIKCVANERVTGLCDLYSANLESVWNFNAARAFYRVRLFPQVRRVRRAFVFEGSETSMSDFMMIVLGVGFFVASVLYVLACERM